MAEGRVRREEGDDGGGGEELEWLRERKRWDLAEDDGSMWVRGDVLR